MSSPNIIVDEEYGTRYEKSRGGRTKVHRKFIAFAHSNFDAYLSIRSYIVTHYPENIETLTVTEEDETSKVWHGECTFSAPDLKKLLNDSGLPEYSFSTKGGTAHIVQSRKTVGVYPGWRPKIKYTETSDGKKKMEYAVKENGKLDVQRETVPNFRCGINWNEESGSFDGTEIIVPSWKSTVKITVPNEFIDANYLRMLRLMTGSVNSSPFDGMAKGECLFAGCDGSRRVQENQQESEEEGGEMTDEPPFELVWDLSFEFLGAPNRKTRIDNIGYVKKRGWEFMHMVRRPVNYAFNIGDLDIPDEENEEDEEYQSEETDDSKPGTEPENKGKTISTPVAAYIEQVYPYANFGLLGFKV